MLFYTVVELLPEEGIALEFRLSGEIIYRLFYLFAFYCEPSIKAVGIACPHASVTVILGQESSAPCGLDLPAK